MTCRKKDQFAERFSGFRIEWSHIIVVTLNGLIGTADYDKRNPIYEKTQDDNRYGVQGNIY
ncbi:MAG: hypothetical protein GY850_00630 [bacterium]|nr:hypothetical protein [bacterium]